MSDTLVTPGDGLSGDDQSALVARVASQLDVPDRTAAQVVDAFDAFVVEPMVRNLEKKSGKTLARRNPFVYAALGQTKASEWARRVLDDILTSSAEGLMGNFLEEVARIISGGTKPGSGVDLQRDMPNRVVELYAIQSTTNTKNAGGRKSDLIALRAAAGALTAQRRHPELYVGYLFGRQKTTARDHVTNLSSKDFWRKVSGKDDFLDRLGKACVSLSAMYSSADAEVERIVAEAVEAFADTEGNVKWEQVVARSPNVAQQKGD